MPEMLTMDTLRGWRARHADAKVVATNGCFDLLHVGHVGFLRQARRLGDLLVVGVNSDDSVRGLKGYGRPVVPENDRAELVLAIRWVDAVCVFSGARATQFLHYSRPDVYVKGGDYTAETLNDEEAEELDRIGADLQFVPRTQGSTTGIIGAVLGTASTGGAGESLRLISRDLDLEP